MRLLVCLIASAAFHLAFVQFHPTEQALPALSISLEARTVDLQIRTRAKKIEVSPLPSTEKPEPTPPPAPPKPKKNTAKLPMKKATPRPTPKREEAKKTLEPIQKESKPKEYVSTPQKKPRLIERAEYLSNPPPEYPEQARRRRQQGTVTLLVRINAQGFVEDIQTQKSSGFSLLDKAAQKAVTSWRFSPASAGSQKISSQVLVPVQFALTP